MGCYISVSKGRLLRNISLFALVFIILGLLGFPVSMLMGEKQGKVELNEKIDLPFPVNKEHKVVVLYLGYLGCQTICMPSLEEIASVYTRLNTQEKVGVYFVNLSNDSEGLESFVDYFHRDFIGIQPEVEERKYLIKTLHAYRSDPLREGGEISHTGYLYLIRHDGSGGFTLKTMYYTRPFDVPSIVNDIDKEIT